MRVFDGQVHLLEIAALIVASFLAYAMGYSLPLLAAIFLVFWPLLLLQLLAQGVFEGVFRGLRWLYRSARPPKPQTPQVPPAPVVPRAGAARFLWLLPLLMMTLGYGRYVVETGRWFL